MEDESEVATTVSASPRMYWGFLAGYAVLIVAHYISLRHGSSTELVASDVIVGMAQWLTIAALLWRWRRSSFPNTLRWGAVILASAFIQLANDNDLVMHIRGEYNNAPGISIFCDAVDTALIVLTCSTTFRGRRMGATNLIDGAMAIGLTGLFFIRVFSLVSISGTDSLDNVVFIVRMFDVLGVFMILCAGVRLLGAERTRDRHFFFVLAFYLLTSTVFAAARNRLTLAYNIPYVELLLLPQWIVFGMLCLRRLPRWLDKYQPKPSLVHVTESLSPLFLGLGLLCVSLSISNGHPTLGATGASMAVIAYGIRNVITQSEQMATERSLLALQGELQNLVVTDPLSGIANRRGFDASLERLWNRVQSSDLQLSILMIDIDHFKRFNDNHGHALGDVCLTAVAKCLDEILTPLGCFAARYGGEEFAALLPATTLEQAKVIGERLRQSVAEIRLPNADEPLRVTVSIGLANSERSDASGGKALLILADEALYEAKRRGRNQVASHGIPEAESSIGLNFRTE